MNEEKIWSLFEDNPGCPRVIRSSLIFFVLFSLSKKGQEYGSFQYLRISPNPSINELSSSSVMVPTLSIRRNLETDRI